MIQQLTCNLKGRIVALDADFVDGVRRNAVVNSDIGFIIFIVDNPQEEELTGR